MTGACRFIGRPTITTDSKLRDQQNRGWSRVASPGWTAPVVPHPRRDAISVPHRSVGCVRRRPRAAMVSGRRMSRGHETARSRKPRSENSPTSTPAGRPQNTVGQPTSFFLAERGRRVWVGGAPAPPKRPVQGRSRRKPPAEAGGHTGGGACAPSPVTHRYGVCGGGGWATHTPARWVAGRAGARGVVSRD